MSRKSLFNSLYLILLYSQACFSGQLRPTEDPLRDFIFRKSLNVTDKTKVMMFRVDINVDGAADVFLSTDKDINGHLGNIWEIYLSTASGFDHVTNSELLTLNYATLLFRGKSNPMAPPLMALMSPEHNVGVLWGYTVSGGSIIENKLAKIEFYSGIGVDTLFDLAMDSKNQHPLVIETVENIRGRGLQWLISKEK